MGHLAQLRRQVERLYSRYLCGNDAHHYRIRAALREDIDAKSGALMDTEGDVYRACLYKFLCSVGIAGEQRHRYHFSLIGCQGAKPFDLDWGQLAVDLYLRRSAYGKVQIADNFTGRNQHLLD